MGRRLEFRPPPPEWLAFHAVHEVEVREGESVRLDLDLARGARCRLAGTLRLDGGAPRFAIGDAEGVPLTFATLSSDEPGGGSCFAHLADDGTFELGSEREGSFGLRLEFTDAAQSRWTIADRVHLSDGASPWALDLATGTLRIQNAPAAEPVARASAGNGVEVEVRPVPPPGGRGSTLFLHVPAGRVRIEAGGRALECDVRAGATTEVDWSLAQ